MLDFFADPTVSLVMAQMTGLLILFSGFDNDKLIFEKSSTYWEYNKNMARHFIKAEYDKKIGVLSVTIPTILQEINTVPFWVGYAFLFLAIALRFSCMRRYYIDSRAKNVEQHYKEMVAQLAEANMLPEDDNV